MVALLWVCQLYSHICHVIFIRGQISPLNAAAGSWNLKENDSTLTSHAVKKHQVYLNLKRFLEGDFFLSVISHCAKNHPKMYPKDVLMF